MNAHGSGSSSARPLARSSKGPLEVLVGLVVLVWLLFMLGFSFGVGAAVAERWLQ